MNQTLNVFHLDDDEFDLELVKNKLEQSNSEISYQVRSFTDTEAFIQAYKSERTKPEVILLDYSIESKDLNGIEFGKILKKLNKDQIIILLSYIAEEQLAKASRAAGLDNYITKKSINFPNFSKILGDTYSISKYGQLGHTLNPLLKEAMDSAIGDTMKFHIKRLPAVASSNIKYAIVTGEKGTGKSFYLKILSEYLQRQGKRILQLDSTSISEQELKEFSTTVKRTAPDYLFLFNLDSLSHLLSEVFVKLLRSSSCSKTRIVMSATSKTSIAPEFAHLLSGIEVIFPPLRERPSEIMQYCNYLLQTLSPSPTYLDSAVESVLIKHTYSNGNISELKSILRQMSMLRTGNILTIASLPDSLLYSNVAEQSTVCTSQCLNIQFSPSDLSLDYYEDRLLVSLIHKILQADGGSRNKSTLSNIALRLGLSRQTLAKRVNRLISEKLLKKAEVHTWYDA